MSVFISLQATPSYLIRSRHVKKQLFNTWGWSSTSDHLNYPKHCTAFEVSKWSDVDDDDVDNDDDEDATTMTTTA